MADVSDRRRDPVGRFANENHTQSSEVSLAPQKAGQYNEEDFQQELGSLERTPWGAPQDMHHAGTGIAVIGTAGHGGIKLSAERNRKIPKPLRRPGGWYEEDCEAGIPMWVFPDADYGLSGEYSEPQSVRDRANESVRNWYPDEWEEVTGKPIQPGESHQRDEAVWNETHKNDFVANWASTSKDVEGMVDVGCKRPSDGARRTFRVPKDEYKGGRHFVADPERYEDITEPEKPKVETQRYTSADLDYSNMSDNAANRALEELGKRYRWEDGSVATIEDKIEEGHFSGKVSFKDGNRTYYGLSTQEYEDGPHTSIKISKALWQALHEMPEVR